MAETPIIIQLGGEKFIRTADMEVKTVWQGSTGTAKSMQTYGAVNYQVPVGKVFLALEISAASETTGQIDIRISDETTVNTANTANRVLELNSGNYESRNVPINHTFVAGRYIGCINSSGNAHIEITGVEMDA